MLALASSLNTSIIVIRWCFPANTVIICWRQLLKWESLWHANFIVAAHARNSYAMLRSTSPGDCCYSYLCWPLLGIPAFLLGTGAGRQVLPAVTKMFYNMSNVAPTVVPTPQPAFPAALPQVGSLLYTVQAGDNCDEILTYKMRMTDAGTIFSDVKPQSVSALGAVIGQNCHALQPGMVLTLDPQYPLVAIGGVVLKIETTTQQQVLPTPLINVAPTQQPG